MLGNPIPHHEIDTPWEPQPIAWRYTMQAKRHDALRSQVEAGLDHVVREVLADVPEGGFKASTLKQANDSIFRANEEFDLLRTCGLSVPPTEWHIFEDGDGITRVLARVATIKGIPVEESDKNIKDATRAGITEYYESPVPGLRLSDIYHIGQYTYGQFAQITGDTDPAPTLHDIEPLFRNMNHN